MRARRQVSSWRRLAPAAVLVLGLGLALPGLASACTLFGVPSAGEAQLKVFFTRFESEDNTGGKYRKCRIVKKRDGGAQTFFITPFRQDANVVVLKENWPK